MTTFTVKTPAGFRFWPTVTSHGWCDLHPFSSDDESRTLARIHRLSDGTIVRLVLGAAADESIAVTVE
jgi:hypothetical protein